MTNSFHDYARVTGEAADPVITIEDFEDNDLQGWTTTSSPWSVQTNTVYEGTYAVENTNGFASNTLYGTFTSTNESIAVWHYAGSIPESDFTSPLILYNESDEIVAELLYDLSGNVGAYPGSGPTYTNSSINTNEWYRWRIVYDVDTDTFKYDVIDTSQTLVASDTNLSASGGNTASSITGVGMDSYTTTFWDYFHRFSDTTLTSP